MTTCQLTDLDRRPDLLAAAVTLFAGATAGRCHAVCGEPSGMAMPVTPQLVNDSLGTLCAVNGPHLLGGLAICPYSTEQVTLWGPVVDGGHRRQGIGSLLVRSCREAARDGGFSSLRVLVDQRNRVARSFWLNHGLSPWKVNRLYELPLPSALPPEAGVHPAQSRDHPELVHLLRQGFPDSSYPDDPLSQREHEGYRHYLLQEDGRIVAAAALKDHPGRAWLSLVAVDPQHRGQHCGRRLLAGILHHEAARGTRRLGLEVLEDNHAAIALYERAGFTLVCSATIMTGAL